MPDFLMFTRLSSENIRSAEEAEKREQRTLEAIRKNCPGIEWKESYALMEPDDFLDIFTADDMETALKVSALVRKSGCSHSEIWPAVERQVHKKLIELLD
jgi:uncharacterized protein with GYD domain